jgi:hypothetical protein
LTLTDDAVHLYSDGLSMNGDTSRIALCGWRSSLFLLRQLVSDQLIVRAQSRQP